MGFKLKRLGTALLTGGLSEAGGAFDKLSGADAAKDAMNAQVGANREAIAEQRRQFDLGREDMAPWLGAGRNALLDYQNQLKSGYSTNIPQFSGQGQPLPNFSNTTQLPSYQGGQQFSFDPSQMANNPAYKFIFDQAMQGVNRSAAAGGKSNSGNVLAELQNRAAGLASTEYENEFGRQLETSNVNYGRGVTDFGIGRQGALDQYGINRDVYGLDYQRNQDIYNRNLSQYGLDYQRESDIYGRGQNYLNRLASMSGVGQTTASQGQQAGQNFANSYSNLQGNIGNALAQGKLGSYGAKAGFANNLIQMGGMFL